MALKPEATVTVHLPLKAEVIAALHLDLPPSQLPLPPPHHPPIRPLGSLILLVCADGEDPQCL
ncbi:hypothetical protein M9458_021283, partial [Cirrhinus mrigala]